MKIVAAAQRIDHRYEESGLSNVMLRGLPMVEWGGEWLIDIPHIVSLHRLLLKSLALKAGPLSARELRFLRVELEMTHSTLADLVGRDRQTIGRWERSEGAIDLAAEVLIRLRALEHLNDGALPTVWELRGLIASQHDPRGIEIDAHDPENYRLVDERPAARTVSFGPRYRPELRARLAAKEKGVPQSAGPFMAQEQREKGERNSIFLGVLIGQEGARARLRRSGEAIFIDLPPGPRATQLSLGERLIDLEPGERSRRYRLLGDDVTTALVVQFLRRQGQDLAAFPAYWR